MADYYRDLRPASIRGIPFLVEGDDKTFGRRIVTHEFPGQDEPGHEDMGASVEGFNMDAIIAGDQFKEDADILEAAFKKAGPATLIHPHYGEITVIVLNTTRRHSYAAVGEIQFSVTMQKYSAIKFPTAAANSASGLLTSSTSGFEAALSEFNNYFRATGLPDFVTLDAIARNGDFMGGLNTLLNNARIIQTLPILDVLSGSFGQNVIGLYKGLMDLVSPKRKPIIGAASTASTPSAKSLIGALMNNADQTVVDTAPSTTASRSARAENAQSLDYLHRMASLSAGVGAVRYIQFESREDAIAVRDGLNDRLGALRDQLGASGRDESWRAAAMMQSALQRDINEQIGRLPKTVRIRPAKVRSSLALANRLYGDNKAQIIDRAADIAQRNKASHPGFIPAKELEVLIDAK